jgi:cytoskeleton protein RodZ
MASRHKRNLQFLPAEPRAEPVIDIGGYPVDIGVGELLRLTRERLGHELQTVANQLRIRLAYLEAIEDSRFRDLPGTTYAVGFVRSYADYLGLDSSDIVRRFREEAARIHGRTKLVFPALTAEGMVPRTAVLLLSAAGLVAAYAAWYYVSSRQTADLPLIAEVPDRLIALPPDEIAVPASPSPAVEPLPPAPEAAVPSPSGNSGATTPADGPPPSDREPEQSAAAPVALGEPQAAPADALGEAADDQTPRPETTTGVAPLAPPQPSAAEEPAADVMEAAVTEGTGADSAPETAGVTAPDLPATAASDAVPADAAAPAAADVQVSTPAPSSSGSALAANDIPVAPTLPADDEPASTQEAGLPADVAASVVLEARMDSWIEVLDADGKRVFSQILHAGERYEVPNLPGLTLKTGNAGGLDVLVGGRMAPPLGEVGKVVGSIVLEPKRLLEGTAAPD